mmetsp:Transcript_9581/g.20337  ORF Transcript_9581/g.20337 Transcript_9581/m.20337 type:complete len:104 (+) Transcript_9581:64-375(+)
MRKEISRRKGNFQQPEIKSKFTPLESRGKNCLSLEAKHRKLDILQRPPCYHLRSPMIFHPIHSQSLNSIRIDRNNNIHQNPWSQFKKYDFKKLNKIEKINSIT